MFGAGKDFKNLICKYKIKKNRDEDVDTGLTVTQSGFIV